MELVKASATQVARPLHILVPLIKNDLKAATNAADDAARPHYADAGEKLIEAKSSPEMGRGEFGPWVKRNFNVGLNQAGRWMGFARATGHIENVHRGSVPKTLHQYQKSRGMRQTVYPQPWNESVIETVKKVDLEALKQDALKRQEERALQRKLALSLIDIGYKVLATKLHPDKKGGSREAMSRLNRVRDILREAVSS